MDIAPLYQYIASTDPFTAKAICNKFGFDVSQAQTEMDVAGCLQEVVASHGNDALAAIVDIHPDKELILEMAGPKPADAASCACDKAKVADQYVQNAASAVNPLHNINGNTIIIGAVVILGLAVIYSHTSKS